MTVPPKRKNYPRKIRTHRVELLKPRSFFIAQAGKVGRRKGLPCVVTPEEVRKEP